MQDLIHCFQEAGLGLAPFQYLRCVDMGRAASSCQYCGTGIRYKFYLRSSDGNEFFVGSDCIYKSGDAGLINIAKRERTRIAKEQRDAKNAQKRKERIEKWEAEKQEKIQKYFIAHQTLLPAFDWASKTTGIALDIYNNFSKWGNLTEGQIELLVRLYNDTLKPKAVCPSGKVTIEGTVVGVKWVDSYYGSQEKMTVESKEGYRVFGSVPKSLIGLEKGNEIRFIATVEPSQNDQYFGFFNRPKEAIFVE